MSWLPMVWSATLPGSSPTSLGHGQAVMDEGFHEYRSRPWPPVISLKSQTIWIHGRHCQGCGFPRARQCGYGSFLAFYVVLVEQGQSPVCSEAAFAVLWHIWYMTSWYIMIVTWHKHDITMTLSWHKFDINIKHVCTWDRLGPARTTSTARRHRWRCPGARSGWRAICGPWRVVPWQNLLLTQDVVGGLSTVFFRMQLM